MIKPNKNRLNDEMKCDRRDTSIHATYIDNRTTTTKTIKEKQFLFFFQKQINDTKRTKNQAITATCSCF